MTWRVRYRDEDIYGSRGEHNLESYLQVDQKLPKRLKLSLRGTLGRDLADPAAEWAEACDRAGVPELEGTCVVTDSEPDEIERNKPYGMIWGTAEVRF